MKIINLITIVLSCVVLQACYPVYQTIRAPVQVIVLDEQGKTLEGAKVVMETTQRPAYVLPVFNRLFTDTQGIVKFKRKREWAMETLFIHGFQVYRWNLCVSQQGYQMLDQIDFKAFRAKQMHVVLKKQKFENDAENECFDETMDQSRLAY